MKYFEIFVILCGCYLRCLLYFTFIATGSLFGSVEAAKSGLQVKLMQVAY